MPLKGYQFVGIIRKHDSHAVGMLPCFYTLLRSNQYHTAFAQLSLNEYQHYFITIFITIVCLFFSPNGKTTLFTHF